MHHTHSTLAFILLAVLTAACSGDTSVPNAPAATPPAAPTSELSTMTARFAPAEISASIGGLPDNERQALAKLVDAARIMDGLFLRQVWAGNDALLERLARESVVRRRRRRGSGSTTS